MPGGILFVEDYWSMAAEYLVKYFRLVATVALYQP